MICTKEGDANEIWKKAGEALADVGLHIDQAKPKYARTQTSVWSSQTIRQAWASVATE